MALQHEVTTLYITFDPSNTSRYEIEEQVKNRVHSVVVYCKPGLFKWLIKYRGFKRGLAHLKAAGKNEFDVIHHNVIWNDGWQAAALRKWRNLPMLITEHWTGYDPMRKKDQAFLLKPFAKWVASNADCICPVSEDLKNKMQAFGLSCRYEVIPNVVDTRLFNPGVKNHARFQFLHLSHLVDSHKNITGILRTWKRVSDRLKTVHLQIGGDGDHLHWKEVSRHMEIDPDSISFFGEQPPENVAVMMSTAHCLILFSNYENLPVVMVEAMASGMFIISSDVGGISEHLDDKKGILVPVGDESALAQAIEKVAQGKLTIDPENIRLYADEHFSEGAVCRKYSALYQDLL